MTDTTPPANIEWHVPVSLHPTQSGVATLRAVAIVMAPSKQQAELIAQKAVVARASDEPDPRGFVKFIQAKPA